MASKFVTLAEAAQQLGIPPEQVNELRQQGGLNGYRDGSSWKFKHEDVQRVAESRSAAAEGDELPEIFLGDSGEVGAAMDLPIDPDDIQDSADDVVLLSEFELGESGPSASATVIGKPGQPFSSLDSDVKLVSSDGGGSDASQTMIGRPGTPLGPDESAVKLESTRFEEPSASGTIVGFPGQPLTPDDSAVRLKAGSADLESPSSTVIGKPGQPLSAGESDVKLGTFEDSDFELPAPKSKRPAGGPPTPPPVAGGSTVFRGSGGPADSVVDSGITLGDEHSDDDFVLGGPGSDITVSPGDSGISLVDPADSGLSLDAPIELRPDSSEGSFEIAESGEDLSAVTEFDSDEVMELKTGDEFLLTPMVSEGEESSDDSGSQVIAVDSESPFESSEASMFASAEGGMSNLLEEDVGGGGALGAESLGGVGGQAFAAAGGAAPGFAVETPYPVWTVLLLGFCALFLSLCGMMMYDLVRNMWSWNGPMPVNSTIMDAIMGLFG